MKPIISSALFAVLFVSNANAQIKYGVKAGINIANWQGDAVKSLGSVIDLTNGLVNTKSRTGFHIGGYVDIPLAENISIEPGLQYSQKGFTLVGNLKIDALKFIGANASAKIQADYIDIPILLKANLSKGLFVYAGPQVAVLVKNNLHLNAGILGISLFSQDLNLTNNFNKTDITMVGGMGYRLDNGLQIAAGYDYGMSRVDKNSSFKAYNRAVKISVGLTF
ncbi:MAG: porin family protein [Ferruginibacter sp.]